MSSSQERIAETISLFYTADKASEVGTLTRGSWTHSCWFELSRRWRIVLVTDPPPGRHGWPRIQGRR